MDLVNNLRPWEQYWSKGMKNKRNFLRNSGQLSHPSRTLIAELASKFDTVLECGCATAIDYPLHVKLGTEYTGIDITQKFVDASKEHNPGINTRWASMLDLPFGDRSYDTVYCRAVLEHMHPLEWPLGVKEMWRVCDKQMILAFFNCSPERKRAFVSFNNSSAEQASILERMKSKTEGLDVGGVYNNSIAAPDVVDVIKWVGGESWYKEEAGTPLIEVDGRKVKTGWKKYHIYVIEK